MVLTMRYDGAVCQICGREFSETDDIVVCPDCGTPHHRQCWLESGQCINSSLHDGAFSWQPAESEKAEPEKEESLAETDGRLPITCPVCKHENPPSSERCETCGQKFTIFGFNVFDKQNELEQEEKAEHESNSAPTGEYAGRTDIDSVSTDDISEYVRTNHLTYVRKFDKLSNQGKKVSWNWASFIFLPYWFFYRKLIKPGIIFLMSILCVSVIFSQPLGAIADKYYTFIDVAVENADEQQVAQAQQQLLSETKKQAPFVIAYFLILLIIRIVAALLSDRLYKKKVVGDIVSLRGKNLDDEAFHFSMFKLGGISPVLVLAAYVAQYALNYLISYVMTLSA